ncbi:hypothetical protein GA0070611_6126 [Micromonospora auratinigra]|uniref:Uncharacterized protein n=2 Tax=Micromonospora auratinigra TaxID=261654 RepID=A0A1A9ABG0_9ACTN|nr:hypothetical protein GA0070611_6126 [Micromonospora auratinigra]
MLSAAAAVVIALGLAGCGKDSADQDGATWADGRPKAPASRAAAAAQAAPEAPAGQQGKTEQRPPANKANPPWVRPSRPTGTPSARKVVDAFKAAGLKVTNVRDRSADCGPDGLGVGCAELITTTAVSVYVFADPAGAGDQADQWSTEAYRNGAVVLNFVGTGTSVAERKRYDEVLDKLS